MNKVTYPMNPLLYCLIFALGVTNSFAQTKTTNSTKIIGVVLDSKSRQPIAYATVILLESSPSTKSITGVSADADGRFTLSLTTNLAYRLRISYVGYADFERDLKVDVESTTLDSIFLRSNNQLNEAVVIGRKPLVEVRSDRYVYNADQDASNAGGTAQDVLRKTPLLTVDGEGSVKMLGSANFKILVNGKPSPMLANNLSEAIKSIPAGQIQTIEVITTPSAKYDAEGTAGIINIILKKGIGQKINGRIEAITSNRSTNINSSLNFNINKLSVTTAGSANTWYKPVEFSRTQQNFLIAGDNLLQQRYSGQRRGNTFYGTLGLDYELSEQHALSFSGSVDGYNSHSKQDFFSTYSSGLTNQNTFFSRQNLTSMNGIGFEGTGTYTRTFKLPRREWSVLTQYSTYHDSFDYDADQYDNQIVPLQPEAANFRERTRSRTPSHEFTVQSDYVQPLGEKTTLELGIKTISRGSNAIARVDTLVSNLSPNFYSSRLRAIDFNYSQSVQAAYATYAFALGKKFTSSIGNRFEYTHFIVDLPTKNDITKNSYYNLLPSGSIRFSLNDTTNFRMAYSRRITRPFINYLNPVEDRTNPQNISFGNPDLKPEITDSYELSYNINIKASTLSVLTSINHTGNAIEQVRLLLKDQPVITAQTFANVASNTFYLLYFYESIQIKNKLTFNGGPYFQYVVRKSPSLNAEKRGFTAGLPIDVTYQFNSSLTLKSYLYAALRTQEIQGRGPSNLYYSFTASKKLMNDRSMLTLNVINPFNAYWSNQSSTLTNTFAENSDYRDYNRAIRLSFSYQFGQKQQEQRRERKQIDNDDKKSGNNKGRE